MPSKSILTVSVEYRLFKLWQCGGFFLGLTWMQIGWQITWDLWYTHRGQLRIKNLSQRRVYV